MPHHPAKGRERGSASTKYRPPALRESGVAPLADCAFPAAVMSRVQIAHAATSMFRPLRYLALEYASLITVLCSRLLVICTSSPCASEALTWFAQIVLFLLISGSDLGFDAQSRLRFGFVRHLTQSDFLCFQRHTGFGRIIFYLCLVPSFAECRDPPAIPCAARLTGPACDNVSRT